MIPGLFGVIARWQIWRRNESGEPASACVCIDAQGVSRCTCVGRDAFGDGAATVRPTDCKHTTILDGAPKQLSALLLQTVDTVRRRLEQLLP